jgi:hypothetical protein
MRGFASIFGVHESEPEALVEIYMVPTVGDSLFNGLVCFWVYAENRGEKPVSFSIADISVRDKSDRSLPLYTARQTGEKLLRNVNTQQFTNAIASSIITGLAAAPFAYSRTTGVAQGYTSSGTYVSGTFQAITPNTTVQYMAQEQNTANIASFDAQIQSQLRKDLVLLDRLSFQGATLGKGFKTEGLVALPLESRWSLPNSYRFEVRIAGRVFHMTFVVKSTKE